jgi:hypothetical protein
MTLRLIGRFRSTGIFTAQRGMTHCLLPSQRLKFSISDLVRTSFAANTSLAVAGSIRLRPLGNLHKLVKGRTGLACTEGPSLRAPAENSIGG